jgi:membrane protein DedA with SNARE-associated domain
MDGQMIIQFLTDYGYAIMFPLMMVFGPIVAIVAAFMSSMGVFNVYVVFLISLVAGMLGDVLLYGAGHKWGIGVVKRFGKYTKITEEKVLKMENAFDCHGGKIIIAVKATTGLCWVTFLAAGIVKMPFWRFFGYTIIGGLLWSSFLVIMGYFFGYMYSQIAQYISYAGWIMAVIIVIMIILWNKYDKKKSQKILKSTCDVPFAKS